jgi:hypothetical protein
MAEQFEVMEDGPVAMEPAMVVEEMPSCTCKSPLCAECAENGHESFEVAEKLPGSDAVVVEEEEQAAKDTNWADDKDHSKFRSHFEESLTKGPPHSGGSIPGCERYIAFTKNRLNELSKAMRSDFQGAIDEAWADGMYKKLQDDSEKLESHLDKLRTNTSHKTMAAVQTRLIAEGKCDKCEGDVPTWHDIANDQVVCLKCEAVVGSEGLTKVAGTPVINVFVSAFERAIVGSLVNGSVAGGKDMNLLYEKLDGKYKFTDREKLAIRQLVADYGFPQILDRVKIDDGDNENDGELARNYHA